MNLDDYIIQQENEKRQKYLTEFFSELSSKTHDRAINYTNLVIGIGYVGFFTAWERLQQYIPAKPLNSAAFLMLVSLAFFIFYEIIKMIWSAIMSQVLMKPLLTVTPETVDATIDKFNKDQKALVAQQIITWIIALCLTLIPALIAAGLLLYHFAIYLLK